MRKLRQKPPAIVSLWIELLRSGEYSPGGSSLCRVVDGETLWSPLGVLCDAGRLLGLCCSSHPAGEEVAFCDDLGGSEYVLPPAQVVKAACLASRVGSYRFEIPSGIVISGDLLAMGSTRVGFASVAQFIESLPPGLFLPAEWCDRTWIGTDSRFDLPDDLLKRLEEISGACHSL